MTRTHEQFMTEINAILARYIAGGYEPEGVAKCPGCRVTLGHMLICPCHPEAAEQHNTNHEGE